MSQPKIPDGIFTFPTTLEGLPTSPIGKNRELEEEEEAVEAVNTTPPPPLWTSSKASFALGALLKKKVRRSEEDTRSDTPPGRPPVETSDPVLGPTREAAADDDSGNEVINIFDSIKGNGQPQYRKLISKSFWHTIIKIYHYWLPFSTSMV